MIYKISIGIIVVLVVFITTSTIKNRIKRNRSKISFKESMDLVELPVVTFYNNNRKLNFLLDTGSNVSHINKSVLSSLDCEKINKENTVMGIEGKKIVSKVCDMILYYKNQKFEGEFSITDLNSAFNAIKKESGVHIHGILGNLFFQKYKYIFDFDNLAVYCKK